MRMRTGRITAGYFKNQGGLPNALHWQRTIYRSSGYMGNATWLSIDNATDQVSMVNHSDVDGDTLWTLAGHLEGDEAVAVVTEHEMGKYSGARQWCPTEADGPLYLRPPGVIVGGDFSFCTLQVPIADVPGIAGYLVVSKRIYVLGYTPPLDMSRVDVVPAEAVAALFADP